MVWCIFAIYYGIFRKVSPVYHAFLLKNGTKSKKHTLLLVCFRKTSYLCIELITTKFYYL